MVNNTNGLWRIWPSGADRTIPETWGKVTFEGTSSLSEKMCTTKPWLYPNPNNGEFNIKLENEKSAKDFSVDVFNIMGAIVYSENLKIEDGKALKHVDLPLLPAGLYMIELRSGTVKNKTKFIIKNNPHLTLSCAIDLIGNLKNILEGFRDGDEIMRLSSFHM